MIASGQPREGNHERCPYKGNLNVEAGLVPAQNARNGDGFNLSNFTRT